jgi:TIR domain
VSYFVQIIKEGDDGNLHALHTYLLGDEAAPTPQHESDHPWGTQPVRIFLSHKYEDRVFVGRVKKILGDRYGIDAFVAHDDIDPSKRWREVIKAALASCDGLIAVLHPEFHASQWCDQEVGWALGRNIPLAAVRRDTATRTQDGFLEEHQDITLGATHGSGEWFLAQQIFQLTLNDTRTHEKGLRALAEAFVNSVNYNNTRVLWTLIEQEPRWESEQLRRFEYAVETNAQVYEASVNAEVPDLVKKLVEKFEPPEPKSPPDPWGGYEPPF